MADKEVLLAIQGVHDTLNQSLPGLASKDDVAKVREDVAKLQSVSHSPLDCPTMETHVKVLHDTVTSIETKWWQNWKAVTVAVAAIITGVAAILGAVLSAIYK